MGFLDKVKAQAEQAVKQGQDKLEDVQAKKKSDGMLRDLGAWYYASKTDRDNGQGPAEMARIVADLQAHEAEHGPLGGDKDDEEPALPPPPVGAGPVDADPADAGPADADPADAGPADAGPADAGPADAPSASAAPPPPPPAGAPPAPGSVPPPPPGAPPAPGSSALPPPPA